MSIDMGFWNDPVVKWGVVAALTLFGIFYMRMRISGARAKEADKKKDPSFHEAKRSVDRLENLDRDLKEIEEELKSRGYEIVPSKRTGKLHVKRKESP